MTRNNGSIHNKEHYSYEQEPSGSSSFLPFVLGAIVGGVIGASLALLYAPSEGSDLRQGMKNALEDLTEGAKDLIRETKTSAEKLFRDVMDSGDEKDPSIAGRMRERADGILEDADRAIAEARRRSSNPSRYDEDED
jgi:gas vesicle protein